MSRASNKFYERHLHAESRSHLYQPFDSTGAPEGGYDSLNRLRQYQRGVLDSTGGSGGNGGGSVVTPISLPNTDTFRDYDLDGLGNWRHTEFEPVGDDPVNQIRQHNKLNQITSTKDDTDAAVAFTYDGTTGHSNGNLADDGVRLYTWDALKRGHAKPSTGCSTDPRCGAAPMAARRGGICKENCKSFTDPADRAFTDATSRACRGAIYKIF